MKRNYTQLLLAIILSLSLTLVACKGTSQEFSSRENPLKEYVQQQDPSYRFELVGILKGEGYRTHVLKMVSGQWLSENEVEKPEWWHWVHIVEPEQLNSSTAILVISGGDRKKTRPSDANELTISLAKKTNTIAIQLHNVPNQPTNFVGDDGSPRYEDWLIAYGWRKFMEAGAKPEAREWLPRFPMTRAAVRAMDTASEYAKTHLNFSIENFVVAGASKRGWTTWTTAIADDRVIAIAPIVIDVLNTVPSFKHHWRAYGRWAEAVDDYVNEGIMEWFGSKEFEKLLKTVEPYSYIKQLTLPKMMINATGDQFFLPDSWQFYWDKLEGEKHIRYVPNTGHGLDESDAPQTLLAFYQSIVKNVPRPEFDWKAKNGVLYVETDPQNPPQKITLWQAHNPNARDFRVDVAGKVWNESPVELSTDGRYELSVPAPEKGWRAFMAELTFEAPDGEPFKLSTGVVVVPETLPYPEFVPAKPMGTR